MSDTSLSTVAEGKYYWQLVFDYDNSENTGEIRQTYNYKKKTSVTSKQFISSKFGINTSFKYNNKVSASVVFEGLADVGASSEYIYHIDTAYELQKTSETSTVVDEEMEQSRVYTIGPNSKLKLYQLCYSTNGVKVVTDTFATNPKADTIVKLRFSCHTVVLGLEDVLEKFCRIVPGSNNKDEWSLIRETILRNIAEKPIVQFKTFVETLNRIKPGKDNIDEWANIRMTCSEILAAWDTSDRQLLFNKLLQRFSMTHPGVANLDEWHAIRTLCTAILSGLKEIY